MKQKQFVGENFAQAMSIMREEMGDEAIIIDTLEDDDKCIITAQIKEKNPYLQSLEKIKRGKIKKKLQEIGVSDNKSDELLQNIELSGDIDAIMQQIIAKNVKIMPIAEFQFRVPLFYGSYGVGKSSLALRYAAKMAANGRKATILSCDNRTGRNENMRLLSEMAGVGYEEIESPDILHLFLSRNQSQYFEQNHALVIDIFPCNVMQNQDMQRLDSYIDLQKIEPIMVIAADMAGEYDYSRSEKYICTRCDAIEDAKYRMLLPALEYGMGIAGYCDNERITKPIIIPEL